MNHRLGTFQALSHEFWLSIDCDTRKMFYPIRYEYAVSFDCHEVLNSIDGIIFEFTIKWLKTTSFQRGSLHK